MFSVWRSLPVHVTQFSQAVKSPISYFFGVASSLPPPLLRIFSFLFAAACLQLIIEHLRRSQMQRRSIKGWNEHGGRQMEISRRKRKEWRERGRFYRVSVGCAVCSLISSARKVWRGGGRRVRPCSLWLKEKQSAGCEELSVWRQMYNKSVCLLPFCKQKSVPPCWCLTSHWFSFSSPLWCRWEKKSH